MKSFRRYRILPSIVSFSMAMICLSIIAYGVNFLYSAQVASHRMTAEQSEALDRSNKIQDTEEDEASQILGAKNSSNSEMEIDKLSFESVTEHNHAYKINAQKAVKQNDGKYLMDNVVSALSLEKGSMTLDARHGVYEDEEKTVILSDNIIGKYLGYDFKANQLNIIIDKQIIRSDQKVEVESKKLKITSDNFESIGEDVIIFEGNVETDFYPN